MALPKQNKSEVPAGALSNLTPGSAGGIIQLTPEDEVFVNDYAQENGIPKAEALRRLLLHSQAQREMPPKPSTFDKGMDAVYQAQQLGFGSTDPNDAINMMGRSLALKNIGDAMKPDQDINNKKGKISIEDIKELMYLKMMGTLAGDNNNNQPSSVVQDMKAENDKLRQELKDADTKRMAEMDKLRGDMRDMLFEKKIQTLEETNTQTTNSLANQLADINQKIEFYRTSPNATPEQAKDAVSHLEDLGKQVSRIKNVFGDLGIIPSASQQTHTLTPGSEVYREKDGSINKTMYAIDKISGAVEKYIDAGVKKKPDFERLEDTPPPTNAGDRLTIQMTMTPYEYFNFLLAKPELTQDEANYIMQNKHKYLPPPAPVVTPYRPPSPQSQSPETPIEIPEPEPILEPEEKKSMVERLKEQEEEQIRRSQELGI